MPLLLALATQTETQWPETGYGAYLLKVLLVLVLVCAGGWLFLRVGLRRLRGVGPAGREPGIDLRVLARMTLEPRRSVYVIEAAGRRLLVGASAEGPLSLLADLTAPTTAAASPLPFHDVLRRPPPRHDETLA